MHQKELYEQTVGNNIEVRVKPTIEQIKKRVVNFLINGNDADVQRWILESVDIYNIMYDNVLEWDNGRYRDEYDNLVEDGLIDEDELEEG